ncbi:MAG: alpha/beta hydrolase [Sphingomicrobium sp.]
MAGLILVLPGLVCASEAAVPTEQAKATPAEWYAQYVRYGELVPLGNGRSLNLYCAGSGSPAVVLEAGLGESAFTWWAVQWSIARQTRVCAYDRAGSGGSPPGPFPRDTRAQVADLETLLSAAKMAPPYILVGHSMAGYNMRVLAARHLRDVAGMVLVDPSTENQIELFRSAIPAIAASEKASLARVQACANPGRTFEIAAQCTRRPPPSFPPVLAKIFAERQGLTAAQTNLSEFVSFRTLDSRQLSAESRRFGSMPLIVLTRGTMLDGLPKDQAELQWKLWNETHERVAKLSTAGSNRVVAGSGHYIHIDKPDAVIAAVAEVINLARRRRPR